MLKILCWPNQILPQGCLALVYFFCVAINALYVFTLVRVYRSTKSMLLITVILLLITANTTLATFFCINRVYHMLGCDYISTPDQFNMTNYTWAVIGISLSSSVSTTTSSVSQWLFAESYWTLGFKIEKNISLTKNGEHLMKIKCFSKVLVAMIISDSVLTLVLFICIQLTELG